MSSLCSLSARVLIAGTIVGFASAQQINFPSPSSTLGFGAEALIISDVDGGGRRDVVVSTIDPTLNSSGIQLMSSENSTVLGSFLVSNDFGRALANVGDIDGVPGEDFVVSFPAAVAVFVFSGALPLNPINAFSVSAPVTTMATLPDLDGDGGSEVALGSPQTNQVLVLNVITGSILFTISDPRNGGFATSLAAAGNRLAVGAPNYSSTVPPNAQIGYVDVFKLDASTANFATTFAAPGPATSPQQLGNSLAAIGDLDGDGLSEYAVQAPAGTASVHVFSELTPAAPLSSFNYTATGPAGRTAALADIDGDNRGDFAMSDGTSLFLFATPTNATLSLLITVPPLASGPFSGCVVSGLDVYQQGVEQGLKSLVTGQVPTTSPGQARVEPIAMLRNLPNPPNLTILPGLANPRPFAGSNYPIVVSTTSTTPVTAVLMVDSAPAKNIPFGNGRSYVGIGGSAVTLGVFGLVAGTPVTFTNITLPSAAFIGNGLVFQAGAQTQQNTFFASNALLTIIGTE